MLPELVVALTLYYEAGGEGREGILEVASVISERASRSGLHPADVCQQRKQFSCWNNNTPKIPDLTNPRIKAVWEFCEEVARNLPRGRGYTHYHTKKCKPAWSLSARVHHQYKIVGNHMFFKAEHI